MRGMVRFQGRVRQWAIPIVLFVATMLLVPAHLSDSASSATDSTHSHPSSSGDDTDASRSSEHQTAYHAVDEILVSTDVLFQIVNPGTGPVMIRASAEEVEWHGNLSFFQARLYGPENHAVAHFGSGSPTLGWALRIRHANEDMVVAGPHYDRDVYKAVLNASAASKSLDMSVRPGVNHILFQAERAAVRISLSVLDGFVEITEVRRDPDMARILGSEDPQEWLEVDTVHTWAGGYTSARARINFQNGLSSAFFMGPEVTNLLIRAEDGTECRGAPDTMIIAYRYFETPQTLEFVGLGLSARLPPNLWIFTYDLPLTPPDWWPESGRCG